MLDITSKVLSLTDVEPQVKITNYAEILISFCSIFSGIEFML